MDDDKSVQRILMCINSKIKRGMMQYASKYLHDTDLKPPYLVFLFYIKDHDGSSQKDLNGILPYDKSYVSVIVSKLIDMGLVVNTGEGKTHSLHLTEHGRNLAVTYDMLVDLLDDRLFGNFTEEERRMFIHCLRKLDDNVAAILEETSSKTDNS